MKAKILTSETAELLGLKKKEEKGFHNKFIGGGAVASMKDGVETLHENYTVTENNKRVLIFMSKERIKYLKERKKFSKYMKQFDKIPKEVK